MRITQKIQKDTLEPTLDSNIDRIRHIRDNGITEAMDALLIDSCLQYVILMSEIRTKS